MNRPLDTDQQGSMILAMTQPRNTISQYAEGYQAAMRELAIKIVDEGTEAAMEYLIANCPEGELAQRVVDAVSADEPKDELCIHCREAIERRGGEVVTKYGNDPQCDQSPNSNHRFR